MRLARSCDVSIVIPTLNEAPNLPQLLARIDSAMKGRTYEVILVDDNSTDNTEAVCRALSGNYPLRLLVRQFPFAGLSGAVLRGMNSARGETFVVMDADLQHPPEKIPDLLAALRDGAEFALGSRYVPGGSTERNWGAWRIANSNFATFLAKPFAGKVRDPMSGFFAMRADTFERGTNLNPIGYKIALELICKCGIHNIQEVPIPFGVRAAGDSKLTWKQRRKFIQHLGRLYAFTFPRTAMIVKWIAACGGGALFAAATNAAMIPVIAPLAGIAVAYATRATRPVAVPFGRRTLDREVDLRPLNSPTNVAA